MLWKSKVILKIEQNVCRPQKITALHTSYGEATSQSLRHKMQTHTEHACQLLPKITKFLSVPIYSNNCQLVQLSLDCR